MLFICLAAIFYIFYFTDVVRKFAERDTTLVLSQEIMDVVDYPFITFCMQPKAKKAVLEDYKLSKIVLNEPDQNDKEILVSLNETIETLFREATFKINLDFDLHIKLWYYKDGWKYYKGKIHFENPIHDKV